MPEESLVPYTGDHKNQHGEELATSAWKLARVNGWKGAPGCVTQGKGEPSFVNLK